MTEGLLLIFAGSAIITEAACILWLWIRLQEAEGGLDSAYTRGRRDERNGWAIGETTDEARARKQRESQ